MIRKMVFVSASMPYIGRKRKGVPIITPSMKGSPISGSVRPENELFRNDALHRHEKENNSRSPYVPEQI